jgi:hypothetical protein
MGVRIPGDTNGEAPPRLSKLVLQTFLLRQFSVDRAYVTASESHGKHFGQITVLRSPSVKRKRPSASNDATISGSRFFHGPRPVKDSAS